MDYNPLLATINVEQHECSLLLVDAKPLFHERVAEYVARRDGRS